MKYRQIPSDLFQKNRRKLAASLPAGAFAVFHSGDLPWRSADGSGRFIQSSDLFYLTGVDQEETILFLCPSHPDPAWREILLLREGSELLRIWEGHKLTQEEASAASGITTVRWTNDRDEVLRRLTRRCRTIFLNHNEHTRSSAPLNASLDDRFRLYCQAKYPQHHYARLAPLMHALRVAKEPEEVALLQTAVDITGRGFLRVLSALRPGVMEYELEAELLHEFVRSGSRGFAYEPIIASGMNATILHYVVNNQRCREGDLVLLDVAAEYANYNADLTRTIPVSGRYTPRQRAVYDAVLRIVKHCRDELVRPGKLIRKEYAPEVARNVEEELIELGLLEAKEVAEERKQEDLPEEKRLYRKYFMHGVSHSLGLDVHDVAPVDTRFVENMCITIEPGIYLPGEGFGIRLENDVMVHAAGNVDLMDGIPIEADEIEERMAQGKI